MSDDSDSLDLEILEALARVGDIGDFRLGDFMRQLGMNPGQPTIFYRKLIKEAREDRGYKKFLDGLIDYNHKEIAKLEADVSSKDKEIRNLRARADSLQGESQQKTDERHQLESNASQLKQKAEDYELVKEFLSGQINADTVGALYRLLADMNEQILYARIEGRPPPNPSRLEDIRQKLRDDLLEVLQIPKDTLETENKRLKEQIDAIVAMLKRVYGGEGKQ